MRMSFGELGEKHLGLEARRRRWDTASRYGGYGGKSVVKARPLGGFCPVRGLGDVGVEISRPTEGGEVLVSELDGEVQGLLKAAATPAEGGRCFRLAELLERACVSKSTAHDRSCCNVLVNIYSVEGAGWAAQEVVCPPVRTTMPWTKSRQAAAHAEGPFCDHVQYSVYHAREQANLRRAPVGSQCILGCSVCGRRGICRKGTVGRLWRNSARSLAHRSEFDDVPRSHAKHRQRASTSAWDDFWREEEAAVLAAAALAALDDAPARRGARVLGHFLAAQPAPALSRSSSGDSYVVVGPRDAASPTASAAASGPGDWMVI